MHGLIQIRFIGCPELGDLKEIMYSLGNNIYINVLREYGMHVVSGFSGRKNVVSLTAKLFFSAQKKVMLFHRGRPGQ